MELQDWRPWSLVFANQSEWIVIPIDCCNAMGFMGAPWERRHPVRVCGPKDRYLMSHRGSATVIVVPSVSDVVSPTWPP